LWRPRTHSTLGVRDYHGSVHDTEFTETIIRETPIVQPLWSFAYPCHDFVHLHSPCLIDSQAHTVDNISTVPRDKHNFTSGYVDQVNIAFPAECACGLTSVYPISFIQAMHVRLVGSCSMGPRMVFFCSPQSVQGLVTKAMPVFKALRTICSPLHLQSRARCVKKGTGLNIRVNGEELCAKGTVLQTTVCTKFDWQWLFFLRSL
jgi:hypothetical protein